MDNRRLNHEHLATGKRSSGERIKILTECERSVQFLGERIIAQQVT